MGDLSVLWNYPALGIEIVVHRDLGDPGFWYLMRDPLGMPRTVLIHPRLARRLRRHQARHGKRGRRGAVRVPALGGARPREGA